MSKKATVDILYQDKTYRKVVNSNIYPEELGFQIVNDIRYLQDGFTEDELQHLLQNITEVENVNQMTEEQITMLRRFLPHPIKFETMEQGILKTIVYGFILTHKNKEIYHYTVNFDTQFFSFEAKTDLYSEGLYLYDEDKGDDHIEQYSFDNLTLFMERYGKYR